MFNGHLIWFSIPWDLFGGGGGWQSWVRVGFFSSSQVAGQHFYFQDKSQVNASLFSQVTSTWFGFQVTNQVVSSENIQREFISKKLHNDDPRNVQQLWYTCIAELPELYHIEKTVSIEMQVKTTLKKHFWAHFDLVHVVSIRRGRSATMIDVLWTPIYKAAVKILGTISGVVYPIILHLGEQLLKN